MRNYVEQPSPGLIVSRLSSDSVITRSANTFATVTGLTATVGIGRFLVFASLNVQNGTVNGSGEFGLAINGTMVANTQRNTTSQAAILGLVTLSTNYLIWGLTLVDSITTTAPTDVIDVRYRSIDGQTISVGARTMLIVRY